MKTSDYCLGFIPTKSSMKPLREVRQPMENQKTLDAQRIGDSMQSPTLLCRLLLWQIYMNYKILPNQIYGNFNYDL